MMELINESIEVVKLLSALAGEILVLLSAFVGLCAYIAKHFPPPKPTLFILPRLHRFINWVGQNSGYAENKNDYS